MICLKKSKPWFVKFTVILKILLYIKNAFIDDPAKPNTPID